LEFYAACRHQGITPVIGSEVYMAHEHRSERPARRGRLDDTGGDAEGGRKLYYHLTLLAEDNVGYRNLIALSSLAFLEGYYYKPRVDWELLDRHHHGLIATTGCLGGHGAAVPCERRRAGRPREGGAPAGHLRTREPLRGAPGPWHPAPAETNPKLLAIAARLNAPVLATNDSHYTHQHDHLAHDALLCVQTGALMSDPKRFKFEGDQHYLKPAAEMRHLFRERPGRVRQHAVGGRAGQRRDRVRHSPSCRRSPCRSEFASDTALSRAPHAQGRDRAMGP
jgi:DNA polymerase-3 subunit alpha